MPPTPPHLASLASTYALIILVMLAGITVLIVLLRHMLGRPPRRHDATERIQIGHLLCRDGIIFTDDWSMRDYLLIPDLNNQLTITISRRSAGKSHEIVAISLARAIQPAASKSAANSSSIPASSSSSALTSIPIRLHWSS